MSSLKPKFNELSLDHPAYSLLWIFWAISIDNDRQQQEKKRKQIKRHAQKKQVQQQEIRKKQTAFRL